MNITIYDPFDKSTPAEKIRNRYEFANISAQVETSLVVELRELERADENERRTTFEREEAKALVRQYLAYVRASLRKEDMSEQVRSEPSEPATEWKG